MHIYSVQSICIINILIIFVLDRKSNSIKLDDLKLVCMYEFPFDFSMDIKVPDEFCTAVGSFNIHPYPPEVDINQLKGKKPYVFFYNINIHEKEGSGEKKPVNVLDFYGEIDNKLKELKIVNVLILDFSERDPSVGYPIIPEKQEQVANLLKEIKKNHKDILVGLLLFNSIVKNQEFILSIIDEFVDLYVVATYDYVKCVYYRKQDIMAKPPTEIELENSILNLVDEGYNIDKIFLTIEVVVKSWKNMEKSHYEKWSYSHTCSAKPGDKRKYCTQSLSNLREQASTARCVKVKGVFIQSVDFDDWKSTCTCGPFPALKVIKEAYIDDTEDSKLTSCTNFGRLPKHHT